MLADIPSENGAGELMFGSVEEVLLLVELLMVWDDPEEVLRLVELCNCVELV